MLLVGKVAGSPFYLVCQVSKNNKRVIFPLSDWCVPATMDDHPSSRKRRSVTMATPPGGPSSDEVARTASRMIRRAIPKRGIF